ncbi:hypothetical protein [Bacillus sp. SD088]|uniref:hypothetical protein n=1 Tax=Bacillus sp. SD088 TaxID=2782012 RepID=UPI001A975904|nr:hypothetical protein [Bacillus sp. SD088]MBO0994525.1 hypothetical protein [Bacillus sp. SD088]
MSKYSNEFKLLVAQRYEIEIISYRDPALMNRLFVLGSFLIMSQPHWSIKTFYLNSYFEFSIYVS